MAELKLKPVHPTIQKYAVFEFTFVKKVPISNLEDCVKDAGNSGINEDFMGSSDEDLADWVCQIVEKWHQGDPANFIYDWEMYFDGTLTKFDVKLDGP